MKTTLAQDCTIFNSTCLLYVNQPQLLKRKIYIYIYLNLCFRSFEVKYLCICNMYFCKNTSLLTGGSSTHETSAGARTGIVRCLDGHRPVPGRASADLLRDYFKFLSLVRHRTMPGRAPYGTRTGTVGIVRYEF